jgi:vancomycin resistance protein YoaR
MKGRIAELLRLSDVLGSWETRYSLSATDSDRTYNLKVGASKLDGHVIKPGEVFSFNRVSGDRTEREGYRVAPVIQAGELIDGLAGGMCQIASTLHAASWFAGLDIVDSSPHSRPSAYITMGLDSTVVYPAVDLKVRNAFDFPVVVHYKVGQGLVRVELLGKQRPYKVAFDREIVEEKPFAEEVREDPTMPAGQRVVDQDGFPGFQVRRRRTLYKDGVVVGSKTQAIKYPPTKQFVRVGTGSPKLKPKQPPSHHKIPKPEAYGARRSFRIFR